MILLILPISIPRINRWLVSIKYLGHYGFNTTDFCYLIKDLLIGGLLYPSPLFLGDSSGDSTGQPACGRHDLLAMCLIICLHLFFTCYAFNHGLLHGNSHDPSAEEKAALAGTDGAPGAANKFVTDSDPRNSNPRIPISHNHAESEITGLVAGLQGKADLSEGKVPASELGGTGADSTKFLRGDRAWAIPPLGNNFVQVTVDFGFASGNEDFNATVTVSAPWVGADSRLICLPSGIATADHDPEDYAMEGITAYPANIIPGVSFDIIVSTKNGTFGTYIINVIG